MRFRALRIEASGEVPRRDDFVFRWTAHHVREIFSALLPRHYTLDGSSIVQLTCGPRGSDHPQYSQLLGNSVYFVEDFDFAAYERLTPAGRERHLLDVVESSLRVIAARVAADPLPVVATAAEVRRLNFQLETEARSLKKRLPSGRVVLHVFRSLSAKHGERWVLRAMRGSEAVEEVRMNGEVDYLDRRDFFRAAELRGTTYVVRNRLGKETFRLECAHLGG